MELNFKISAPFLTCGHRPCFASSQAQRDFFGAHTYERTDKEGTFHCLWDDTHADIGDVAGRIAGEL